MKLEATFAAYSITAGGTKRLDPLGAVFDRYDLHELLKEFLEAKQAPSDNEAAGEVKDILDFKESGRTISGFIESGVYGKKGRILNRVSKNVVYTKEKDDADMIRFYYSAYIPTDSSFGILILQTQGTSGVASVFQNEFSAHCKARMGAGVIRIERVMPANYLDAIIGEGEVKSIRFLTHDPGKDLCEKLDHFGLGDATGTVEYEFRPKKGVFFDLKSYLTKKTQGIPPEKGLATLVAGKMEPQKTMVTVNVNGKSRTLHVDTLAVGRPDIVTSVEVDYDDGLHKREELDTYANELTIDLLHVLNGTDG